MKKIFGSSHKSIECADEAWQWDVNKKFVAIQIANGNLSASRPGSEGNNPAVLSVKPLNRSSPHFRIEVESIGTWVGIGVVDSKFAVNQGKVIGSQEDCFNCSYFHQTTSSLKLEGETEKKINSNIAKGSKIDVFVDFDSHRVLYWNNDSFVGSMESTGKKLEENALYACANLSTGTTIRFCNRDRPTLDVPKDVRPKTLSLKSSLSTNGNDVGSFGWQWSSKMKADAVVLADNDNTASRPSTDGNNPAVLATQPLSKQRNHFRVKIKSVGKWVGIGFADESYKLNGGSTLGSQAECNNCSYFQQDRLTLNFCDKERFDVDTPIAANDIIDVLVDFTTHKVYYWNNEKFVGFISHSSVTLKENKIYPCVNLSTSTTVSLEPNPLTPKIPQESAQAATSKAIASSPQTPKIAPVQWKWSADKKAEHVTLADNGLTASRPSTEGNNPAVFATQALSKQNNHFRVKVKSVGKWVGIGFADESYKLHAGSTLGSQSGSCVNSGYFQQDETTLNLSDKERFRVDIPIAANDIIDVLVDFASHTAYYWNNTRFVGSISHSSVTLAEHKLYPCVNLSTSTAITFEPNPATPKIPPPSSTSTKTTNTPPVNPANNNNVPKQPPPQTQSPVVPPKHWKWSSDKKASAIVLADNGLSASRPTSDGSNPAVLATASLTRSNPHFRVKVTQLGSWVGIGVAESSFTLDGGKIIGKQPGNFSVGYFTQTSAHLQINEKSEPADIMIVAQDVIDIKADFANKKIFFWNNKRLVGFLEDPAIQEGKLYPCVDLASNSSVMLTNEPEPVGLPTQKLASPVTKPASPVTKPVSPVTKPASPVTKPASPVTKPVEPASKAESPKVENKLVEGVKNLNLENSMRNSSDMLTLLVEHESLKYPVKFSGNCVEDLQETIFRIVKPQRAFKIAYWNQDFEDNLVLTDIRDLQNKMKLTLILTDAKPMENNSNFVMVPVDKSSNEFDEVEMQFRADFQNHHEYYVAQRVKNNLLPITFVLLNATKVINKELDQKFDLFQQRLQSMGRNSEELKIRRAYHGTRASNVELICKNGLLKIGNPKNPSQATDPGWFGDPKKGVYVSRHVEYTTKYSNGLAHLAPGDRVKVIMFKVLPGKSFHVEAVTKGMSPTPGYDSHSSPSFLEWYLFDEAQCCPMYALEVQAIENTRVKSDDGSKS